jgi:methionyl-tRNA formyltransferase
LRAVVFAYHEIGYACFEELLNSRIEVSALFTHRDNPNEEIWFRTPRTVAETRRIPVFEDEDFRNPACVERIRSLAPDYLLSFYYRNLLPGEVLAIPKIAAMNLHGSLLPRFRGRCPVNWVLIEGEKKTGVTLHIMEAKPDTGDIVAQREVGISFEDTAHTLAVKLVEASRLVMRETVPVLESGKFERRPQVGTPSYYGGRKPEDGIIDWSKSAEEIYNLTRAVTHPYPGAFAFLEGTRIFIWKAVPENGATNRPPGAVVSTNPLRVQTGRGILRVLSLQLQGSEEADSPTFVASHDLDNKLLGGRL